MSEHIVNPGPKKVAEGFTAACSSDSPIVTETILKTLKRGGNAIDAAIAGSLVQATVETHLTNHTGTVTCLYYEAATGNIHQLDSLGSFPAGLAPFKPVPRQLNYYGDPSPSACIPGFMPGMKTMHERFGSQPWASLCQEAIDWAEEGHPVSSFEYGLNTLTQDFITYFSEGRDFYMPKGYFTPVGELHRSKAMAATLRRVAENGPDEMISGEWARQFIGKANSMGWPISQADMIETPPRWVEPTRLSYQNHEVVTLGPPAHQGVFCAIVLGILHHLNIQICQPSSAEAIYYMAHALRQGVLHWGYVGDPHIQNVPLDVLLDTHYHASLANLIRGSRPRVDLSEHVRLSKGLSASDAANTHNASDFPAQSEPAQKQPSGSCELSIVDSQGNWVQMMSTIQSGGIPGMVIGGIPMVGSHTTFGNLLASYDTRLAKGARLRGTIGNTLVLKEGQPVLSLGSPGNIYCTLPQVLSNVLDFGMAPYSAGAAPRLLPMTDDMTITMEDRISTEAQQGLAALGTRLKVLPAYDWHMGSFQMCWRDLQTGLISCCADPRRTGIADGLSE